MKPKPREVEEKPRGVEEKPRGVEEKPRGVEEPKPLEVQPEQVKVALKDKDDSGGLENFQIDLNGAKESSTNESSVSCLRSFRLRDFILHAISIAV